MKHFLLNTLLCIATCTTLDVAAQSTISVSGTHIIGPCGDTLLLRGVNYAPYDWGYDGTELFIPEIAATGANAVRLSWYANNSDESTHTVYNNYTLLDSALSKCIQADIVPIIGLLDLTCQNNHEELIALADWYKAPEMLALIEKYKHSLIINVANEALYINWTGDAAAGKIAFVNTYKTIITSLRDAGITVPFMIDGSDCGANLNALADVATPLLEHDPLHNMIFSTHAYWWAYSSMDSAQARTMIEYAQSKNFALMFGEVANLQDESGEPCAYVLNYKPVLNMLQEKKLGWLAWSWNNDICSERQITTAGSASSLTAFGTDILTNPNYGLNTNPATKSSYLTNGGCVTSAGEIQRQQEQIRLFPNPAQVRLYVEIGGNLEQADIFVTDINGRGINGAQEELLAGSKYLISLASGLPAGIYLLHIHSSKTAVVKSFAIQ